MAAFGRNISELLPLATKNACSANRDSWLNFIETSGRLPVAQPVAMSRFY